MADAGHDAAARHDGGRAEGKFVRAQERRADDVPARLETAVHAQPHARAQVVGNEDLLRLGQPQFPGDARVLDGTERRRARAARMPADLDDVCVRFDHAGGNGADARLRDQFDGDFGARVDALQVVDELRQVFDAVDVMVGRRRDQRDAGLGVADGRDLRRDLVRRQLAALAGLGALRHFDLQLVCRHEIGRRDAEARGGDLLDGAVGLAAIARGMLAALAAVAQRAEAVGRDGNGLVRFE